MRRLTVKAIHGELDPETVEAVASAAVINQGDENLLFEVDGKPRTRQEVADLLYGMPQPQPEPADGEGD